jgi:hypothetical protein
MWTATPRKTVPTDAEMEAELAEMKADLAKFRTVFGKRVTDAEMKAAFDKVAPKPDWRFPIETTAVLANDYEITVMAKAVEYFTGSKATFTPKGSSNVYVVKAAGYYATVDS